MQVAMAQNPYYARRRFYAWLLNPDARGTILERDFDDVNDEPVTAEPLDWHLARHWPVLARD